MSSLVNYYLDGSSGSRGVTMNDLQFFDTTVEPQDVMRSQIYLSPSPMGHYYDLGANPIGRRPEHKTYEVGRFSIVSPSQYVNRSLYGCKQPLWSNKCQ
jgi:hypothetical protein